MKCSSCGKTIRSKQQCAYCGQVFNGGIEQQAIVPKTKKRKGSVLGVISGILKIVLSLLVLFGAFLYAPKAIDFVMNYLNPSQQQTAQVSESSQESSVEESSIEEPKPALTLANKEVNISKYPLVEVKLTFAEPLTEVTQDTFEFAVKANGQQHVLTHYSLVKEDKNLTLRYNDTATVDQPNVVKEATFELFAPSLNFSHSMTYELPERSAIAEELTKLNTAITPLTTQGSKVAVGYTETTATAPVYSSAESFEASTMISWFVLQRVYEDMAAGKLTAEQEVKIQDDLKATGDQGEMAQLAAGDVVTVDQLIIAAVQRQDVTALNHLIQAVGGPNEFNSWLKQQDYFATEVTSLLQTTASGGVQGAKTNALDLTKLLTALSKDQLVSAEMDAKFKEMLLQTPVSEKYPSTLAGITRRFEITSADTDVSQQHYAAIFEAGDKVYVAVILLDDVKDAAESVSAVATAVSAIMHDVAGLEAAPVVEEPVHYEEPTYYENTEWTPEVVAPSATDGVGE
ncbi:class A beta-lactamase-related serine hydrolase [Aerococcaceae bacterium NML210727]|nr:class A beta-lactamase-related serine hydrolase [Aerococcaceae bacterium NML210727]MCW6653878.1 class A beta-lactamase-related serine hydrolase [Aerococcaceae bacterium NML201296]